MRLKYLPEIMVDQTVSKEEQIEKLYKSIGELKVENDWLKKKLQLLG